MDVFAKTFMTATLLDREPRAVQTRRERGRWRFRLFGRRR
jgi:hypothetical protein